LRRLAPLAVIAVLAGCGGKSHSNAPTPVTTSKGAGQAQAVAMVGDRPITEAQVAALMAYSRARALEEGELFPAPGTAQYAAVRRKAISSLVTLVEYEQKARAIGVRFTAEQIADRAETIESEGTPEGKDAPAVQYAKVLLARLGLARDALFAYATRSVAVTSAEIDAYFEQNRTFYENFPAARKTIREQALALKRNKIAIAFFARLPRAFRVKYLR
jgi:hypothetical protein